MSTKPKRLRRKTAKVASFASLTRRKLRGYTYLCDFSDEATDEDKEWAEFKAVSDAQAARKMPRTATLLMRVDGDDIIEIVERVDAEAEKKAEQKQAQRLREARERITGEAV